MEVVHVLIVDDEAELVGPLKERLILRGFEAEGVTTGTEALELIEIRPFDVVILDVKMPGMDGLETLERLLEIRPDIQVILLTGRASLEQAATAIRIGALDLMEKPADLDTLVEKIQMAATKRWSLEERRIEKRIAEIVNKKGW